MTNSFRHFKEMLSRLSKNELLLLKKRIELNEESLDKNKTKSKKLLKLVLKNPYLTKIETEKELYGQQNKVAFNKLIDRANEKIDEILIGFNRSANTIYSERNYYYFLLKRRLIVLQMKWLRGIEFDMESQFDKIILLAKKFEHYEILIDVLLVKQRYVGTRNGNRNFAKLESEIEMADIKRKAILSSRRIYETYGALYRNFDLTRIQDIKKSISNLKKNYKITGSATVKYYLTNLETELLHRSQNYIDAEIKLSAIEKLLKENISLYTKARFGDLLLNLSNNELYLKQFSLAKKNALLAKTYYQIGSETMATAMEMEFRAHFYSGEVETAKEIIYEVCQLAKSIDSNNIGKWKYLLACNLTACSEYLKSEEILLETKKIDKDKAGWNLGKRLLSIINEIELNDYENAELKILSLEKFIKRISATYTVRKRDKAILRILLKLINENFDFNKVYLQRKNYFDLLESDDPDYTWKIMSPELVVFHEWYKKKMKETLKSAQVLST
jgi:hypothetical protein